VNTWVTYVAFSYIMEPSEHLETDPLVDLSLQVSVTDVVSTGVKVGEQQAIGSVAGSASELRAETRLGVRLRSCPKVA